MSPMIVETLIAARAKLATGWVKGAYALNAKGIDVAPESPDACRWCISGAVLAVMPRDIGDTPMLLRHAIGKGLPYPFAANGGNIAGFNDAEETTHADVLAALDRAIAFAQAEP